MDCDAMDCDAVDSDASDGDGQSGQQNAPRGRRKNSRRHQPVVVQFDHATGYMTSSEVGRGVLHLAGVRGSCGSCGKHSIHRPFLFVFRKKNNIKNKSLNFIALTYF